MADFAASIGKVWGLFKALEAAGLAIARGVAGIAFFHFVRWQLFGHYLDVGSGLGLFCVFDEVGVLVFMAGGTGFCARVCCGGWGLGSCSKHGEGKKQGNSQKGGETAWSHVFLR